MEALVRGLALVQRLISGTSVSGFDKTGEKSAVFASVLGK
jgi:hypothetical protein